MKLRIVATDLHVKNMRLRMPFRFGITTLTECPHLFVRVALEIDGKRTWGMAADLLANKWFTKDPATTYADDIADMLKIIGKTCQIATAAGDCDSVFDLWDKIYREQKAWADGLKFPPLLSGFGVSLVERAAIDAFCRQQETPFSTVLRENRLGINLGRIHEELASAQPRDLLPSKPLRQLTARHTVGLSDPIIDAQITDADRVVDGLPQSLQSCIATYGLTYFKIKLCGDVAQDTRRVRQIAEVIGATGGERYAFTLDANENFKSVGTFAEFWRALTAQEALAPFLSRMICVEQPLHRAVALSDEAKRDFAAWANRPPCIIDESDATLGSAREALAFGYAGTSHKNCKGVIKGIANACLLEYRRRSDPSRQYILTAEDLSNVGPVALMQDLCVVANLGIPHVERNGHHYFKGLSMFLPAIQEGVLLAHPDLYHRHAGGFAAVNIMHGVVDVGSVVDQGFGAGAAVDVEQFRPADQWTYASLVAGT